MTIKTYLSPIWSPISVVTDISYRIENLGQIQDPLERLYITVYVARIPPEGAGMLQY